MNGCCPQKRKIPRRKIMIQRILPISFKTPSGRKKSKMNSSTHSQEGNAWLIRTLDRQQLVQSKKRRRRRLTWQLLSETSKRKKKFSETSKRKKNKKICLGLNASWNTTRRN